MTQELIILTFTAISIGFFHTLFGPDHYMPFITIAKARKWSLSKTIGTTILCGIGHIISSVLLGIIGIIFGITLAKLKLIESFRGNLAAWALIAFGLIYFILGLRQALKNKPHTHIHWHPKKENQNEHIHKHIHAKEHLHIHDEKEALNITPWILFTIFIFGPCEPLIPLFMYLAAKNSLWGLIWVTSIFGTITISTMLSIVLISMFGISFLPMKKLEKYSHALAGAAIFICGIAIQFLRL